MAYADGFSRDPAANSSPPPLGCAAGRPAGQAISATFRTAMAAIAECWNGATDGAPGVKNLRGMAVQDPAAVEHHRRQDRRQRRHRGRHHPGLGPVPAAVLRRALRHRRGALARRRARRPVIPAAITAAWVQLAVGLRRLGRDGGPGRHHRGRRLADLGQRRPGGRAGDHRRQGLTMANLPPDLQVLFYGQTGAGGQFASGTSAKIVSDPNTGGGVAHTHDLVVPGASAHHHTLTPPQLYLAAWKRVSYGTAARHAHHLGACPARGRLRRHGDLHPRPRGQHAGRRHARLPVRARRQPEPDQRRPLGEPGGLAGILPGQTRPVRWPGTIAAVLAGATSPNVVIDVLVDRC
jgi:hypothetical protein